MKSIQTRPLDIQETTKLCKVVADCLRSADVVALSGDLGAGKTTFVSLLAKQLGLNEKFNVSSPTYVIHHVYEAKFPIHHIDLYRLEHPAQVEGLGFEEFLGEQGLTLIEWFEKFPMLWSGSHMKVNIEIADETHRKFQISLQGKDYVERFDPMMKEIQRQLSD